MAQSKRASLAEAVFNVMVGYGVAVAAQMFVFPLFGVHVSAAQNMAIAGVFTVISIVRSYILRRIFNHLTKMGLRPIDKTQL